MNSLVLNDFLLGDGLSLRIGTLPGHLIPAADDFECWWSRRPAVPPTITVNGWTGPAPRFKQAYERDYTFSGQTSVAVALPDEFSPVFDWVKETVDQGLNGVLANWYDAGAGHYIGAHRDSTRQLVPGSPIVTVSYGSQRTFRLRQYRGLERHDLLTSCGLVIVMPWGVNRAWTHEIVKTTRPGRRMSLTFRCFAG